MRIILECEKSEKLEKFLKENSIRFKRDKIFIVDGKKEKQQKTDRKTKEFKNELKNK